MEITALVPAHNEAAGIAQTIASLQGQVDRILVVADNCTDDTVAVAQAAGAEVMKTVGNTARKAGALNQGLRRVTSDLVLAMDADTVLHPGWVTSALSRMDSHVAGVGAIFYADSDRGWLRGCQAREWIRYSRQHLRTGRTFVLSGTAALLRREALEEVGGWDETSITEDFALTVALARHGWTVRSPMDCHVKTETMPTVADLFRQRRRWSLGAIQTVAREGAHPHTAVYLQQQIMLLLGIVAMAAVLVILGISLVAGTFAWSWIGSLILAVFAFERVITVWTAGWRHRVVAALVVPELLYALVLQGAHVAALVQAATGQSGTWTHPTQEGEKHVRIV